MVAIDDARREAREQPFLGESLLPVAAIFGPNASGKSNVIAAFAWLCDAVASSLRAWEDIIPIEPFAFGNGPTKPSDFEVEFMINGVRFEYVLELKTKEVTYEGLFHYPEKKRKRIFERDESGFKIQRGLGSMSGTRELLTPTTLALSIARRYGEPLVVDFARKLSRTQIFGLPPSPMRGGALFAPGRRRRFPARMVRTMSYFEESPQLPLFDEREIFPNSPHGDPREQALALLRLADLGIDDVIIERENDPSVPDGLTSRRIRLLHRTEDELAQLDMDSESEGTRTWFSLIGPVLEALRSGSLLLFDELDASLHPTLSAQLLNLFHSPATNPLGAQLVFTTHDTSLLNHLNRDEVWLTSKKRSGSTRLGALAEFAGERVRKSQNLESAYLHGRFGALPEVDQAEFLRALGLIG